MSEYFFSLLLSSLIHDTKKLFFVVNEEDLDIIMKFYKILKKYQRIYDIKK